MDEKRFILKSNYDWWGVIDTTGKVKGAYRDCFTTDEVVDLLNALHEENVELKNSLKEFEVFESNRIKGAVVTNDDFSVTLHSNNEAYMVCNMLNRFIRSVKNGNKD